MDIKTIEANIEEFKKVTATIDNLINNIEIDWREFKHNAPQILKNNNLQETPEIRTACEFLLKRCTSIEEGIKELQAKIPFVNEE